MRLALTMIYNNLHHSHTPTHTHGDVSSLTKGRWARRRRAVRVPRVVLGCFLLCGPRTCHFEVNYLKSAARNLMFEMFLWAGRCFICVVWGIKNYALAPFSVPTSVPAPRRRTRAPAWPSSSTANALHRAPLVGRPDFFGAGRCLPIRNGVGGFVALNAQASAKTPEIGRFASS